MKLPCFFLFALALSIPQGQGQLFPKTTTRQTTDLPEQPTGLSSIFEGSSAIHQPKPRAGNSKVYDSLTQFLSASTLKERMPLMAKSKRSLKELENSPLANSFPKILSVTFTNRIDNTQIQRSEYFYSIEFEKAAAKKKGAPTHLYVQVSDLNEHDQPLVHTDAFIDLFTRNRLKKFASKPSEKLLTLHAIVESFRYCFDTNIPDHKNTGFLKIRSHPEGASIFNAHFKLNSELARKIMKPTGLPWATPGFATITVGWDTSVPDKPFIKLLKINGFSWDH